MSSIPQGPVAREIADRLTAALSPARLDVIDDSHRHLGHAGHDPRGESHFTVNIVADGFVSKSRVERQRLVNGALRDLLAERVHALSIRALTPAEAEKEQAR